MQRISETARGRWHGILPQLGISPKLLRNRHGPCPMCGGKDRFRFDNKDGKGTWICNKCGSGDGAELVKRVNGVEFKEAAKMIDAVVGRVSPVRPEGLVPHRDSEQLNALWQAASPLVRYDKVAGYLERRCGLKEFPSCLRWAHPNIMLARVTERCGPAVTLHRTWIEGDKATARKLMPGKLPDSVQVELAPWGPVLGIAEGIETALSASALFDVPVWAAISAPLLRKWRPPVGVEKVMIFGDNDESFTGQEAAYALARALSGDLEVEVKIPSIPGWDWNDVHRNNLDNR
jgi:putative DNA primase/helicase